MSSLLIKNGRVMNPADGRDEIADVWVEDGIIREIGTGITADADACIDATGLIVAPGLVDVHVHFRDPGFTHKEDIVTGSRAAARGGFTTVVLMANVNPHVDNEETLRYVLTKGKETGIRVETCANVTMGMQGKEIVAMEHLAEL